MKQRNPNSLSTKATLLLANTLTVMSGATIAPSLPAMQEHFSGAGNVALWVRLVLTVPALFIVTGSPIAFLIAYRLGRKPLLAVSAALYGIACTQSNFSFPGDAWERGKAGGAGERGKLLSVN